MVRTGKPSHDPGDKKPLSGAVALITGGSRGIGEMIARAYVENGARVYITARKAEACDGDKGGK